MNLPEPSKPSHESSEETRPLDSMLPASEDIKSDYDFSPPDAQSINAFTAGLQNALRNGTLSHYEDQLHEAESELYPLLLSKAADHLITAAFDRLASSSPSAQDLSELTDLARLALCVVFLRTAADRMPIEEQIKMAERTAATADRLLEARMADSAVGATVGAARALLDVTSCILIGSEDTLDWLPRSEFSAVQQCIETVLKRTIFDPAALSEASEPATHALATNACLLAAALKSPDLSNSIRKAYDILDAEIDERISASENEEDQNEQLPPLPFDSTIPQADREAALDALFDSENFMTFASKDPYHLKRLLSLTCLRALALTASSEDDMELFEYLLDDSPDTPEYAEALLGLAFHDPEAATPAIIRAATDAADDAPGAIQAIFNLLDRQIAVPQLTRVIASFGPEKGGQTLLVLNRYTERFRKKLQADGEIPGHDLPIEVPFGSSGDGFGILMRKHTLAGFHNLLTEVDDAWDNDQPAG